MRAAPVDQIWAFVALSEACVLIQELATGPALVWNLQSFVHTSNDEIRLKKKKKKRDKNSSGGSRS